MKKTYSDRLSLIASLIENAVVLHVGCCDSPYTSQRYQDGSLLHLALEKLSPLVYGLDIDLTSLEYLRSRGHNVGDRTQVFQLLYDYYEIASNRHHPLVIIMGETIEHVSNVRDLLDSLKPYLSLPSIKTSIVITTPNLLSLQSIIQHLLNRTKIHPDHHIGFTMTLLRQCLISNGFSVCNCHYTSLERLNAPRTFRDRVYRLIGTFMPRLSDTLFIECELA